MKQQAFKIIENIIIKELNDQGFNDVTETDEYGDIVMVYSSDEVAYSVKYDEEKKSFELRSANAVNDEFNEWKVLSRWLHDFDVATVQDAESVGNDFLDIIVGPKRVETVKNIVSKKRKKGDDSNMDPHFLFNRFMNVFPDFRDVVKEEKIAYGDIRYATLTKEYIVPECDKLARTKGDGLEKLCGIFNDIYSDGDLDARGIIIHGILNGVTDETIEVFKEYFSEELQKSYKCSKGLKNKKLKIEKPKTKSKMSQAMEDAAKQQ